MCALHFMLIRQSLPCGMLFVLLKDCCLCRAFQISHLWGSVRMLPDRTALLCIVSGAIFLVSCLAWDGWAQIQLECSTLDLLSLPLCSLLSLPLASVFAPCFVSSRICDKIHVFRFCAIMCWAYLIKPQKQWNKCQATAGFFFSLTIRRFK